VFGEKLPYRLQAHLFLHAGRRRKNCHKAEKV